ncbi:alpha-D-ribose 1-methylphosphonate 5-triphosphate diphosphatase [Thalassovita taeanensis]|uniref:Alpha-D-ribose 1-methylphosphonate 5-triphosphate diphosphatase n=1 Tax=Thalassovita taeanensis TaxID=657014 RepID=A0A1H9BZ36_9RHOB|nr:alpha-D-ribose 1-methylphosphonate 5-triphosphate diphosphatase [Thalassovita taeanensis]SEP94285.1 alpha-D-ribose 1-methylphosphonate 5-triphosphate diphosphatase [Thalassovita taeanensis]
MTKDVILANANVVLETEVICGSVHIRDGIIVAIDSGGAVPVGAEDLEGDLLCPGLIELHTDNLERHIQPRPKVDWPHAAAIIAHDAELAGVGITTVFDALRVGSIPAGTKTSYGKYARGLADEILAMRQAGALRISHYLHLRAEVCSATLIEELAEFRESDRVGIVSLMDHMPGQRQFRDIEKYRAYVSGKYGMQDADFLEHISRLKELHDALGEKHEKAAVTEAQRLGAVLASHDDTTAAHVVVSAQHGIRLAEFPTTVEAARACRDNGIAVMMGAPNLIRGGSHSGNVAAGELAELDLLDIVSSDYVPAALLSSALVLGDMWGDMARGIATVTKAPADAAGLTDRGRIAIGERADLIRVARVAGASAVRETWVQGKRVA